MRDEYEDVFDQVVFAVTCLLHGDHIGTYTIHQRIVAAALEHKGVKEMLRAAFAACQLAPENQ